jgi:AcrR family transcriptional regulator
MEPMAKARVDGRTRDARAAGRDARAELLAAALGVFAERGYREASVDEIAERAGYSKGAVYWHFSSKKELYFALVEERILDPWLEGVEALESAAPDEDMADDASRRFGEMFGAERDLLLVEHEFWVQAVRDPKLRRAYLKRRRVLRRALGRATVARFEHLGAPPYPGDPEQLATILISVASGLVQERLIDPEAVPEDLLGEAYALLYAGHVARAKR